MGTMAKNRKIMLMLEPMGGYIHGILRGIKKYNNMHDNKWSFYRHPDEQHSLLPYLQINEADGIIGFVSEFKEPGHEQKLISLGTPTIAVVYEEKITGLPTIVVDSYGIGQMGAEHLLERGFRHFAYCGYSTIPSSVERGRGFIDRIKKAGYETFAYELTSQQWDTDECSKWDWLKTMSKPFGLMAYHDNSALFAIESCKIFGLEIPNDVAILGVDNDEFFCDLATPPLSSIETGTELAGYEAAELLAKFIAGKKMNNEQVVVRPLRVITRQTTDILAIEDEQISQAIRYIREHSRHLIQVNDIARKVGLSRRVLYNRFHEAIGHSVHDEITRVRTEQIATLLIGTNMPITKIALDLGYSDADHIARYFRRNKGISPLQYRKLYGIK
ncbi:MAG: helix-turn-helix domain-containing protein [Planctomycetes bacterium]|nr:helix-turn-helix domain-containing protein [Planctomycetota bacterium]